MRYQKYHCLQCFNEALLGKWRWSLFYEKNALREKVLTSRHGGWRGLVSDRIVVRDSIWWQDLSEVLQVDKLVHTRKWSTSAGLGSKIPPKVVTFRWRLILNRLPLRDKLLQRNIITNATDAFCPQCNTTQETRTHVILSCSKISQLWMDWYRQENVQQLCQTRWRLTFGSTCSQQVQSRRQDWELWSGQD